MHRDTAQTALRRLQERALDVDPATDPARLAQAAVGLPGASDGEVARAVGRLMAAVAATLPDTADRARRSAERLRAAAHTPPAGQRLLHHILGLDTAAPSGEALAALAHTAAQLLDAYDASPGLPPEAHDLTREFDAHDREAVRVSGLTSEQYAAALHAAGIRPVHTTAGTATAAGVSLAAAADASHDREATSRELALHARRLRQRAAALERHAAAQDAAQRSQPPPGGPQAPSERLCAACCHLRAVYDETMERAAAQRHYEERHPAVDPPPSSIAGVDLTHLQGAPAAGYVRHGAMSGTHARA